MKQTRTTAQKRLIMSIMENNFDHPTADDVYEKARGQDPRISRGTVYRNLNALDESGEIRRVKTPVGADFYDCNTLGHYHFLCRSCNKAFDTEIPYNEKLDSAKSALNGCVTEWHQLVLVGICMDCLEQEKFNKVE